LRLLAAPEVSAGKKAQLREPHGQFDPFELAREIDGVPPAPGTGNGYSWRTTRASSADTPGAAAVNCLGGRVFGCRCPPGLR
jgi:hypothetical protein